MYDVVAGRLAVKQRRMRALQLAFGVVVLAIPFFIALDRARAAGLTQAASYVSAFASVAGCIVIILLVVIALFARGGILGIVDNLARRRDKGRGAP